MSVVGIALSPVQEESLNFPGNMVSRYGPRLDDSILIYLSAAGTVLPIHIMESDSIASVKLRIQSVKGFFMKRQKLVFRGRELTRDNSRVGDYGITDGNVLHLVLRLSDLQAIIVRTLCGKEFEFHVERNRNVGYVKKQITKKGGRFIDLNDQELVCDGVELEDQRHIYEICMNSDAVIHLFVRKSAKMRAKPVQKHFEVLIDASDVDEYPVQPPMPRGNIIEKKELRTDFLLEALIPNKDIKLPYVLEELIRGTSQGLEKGNKPTRSSEGSGGAYLMKNLPGCKYISVFKPTDEEPLAVNNPRGLPVSITGEGLKKGTRVGEGALREVAAFILDHPQGRCQSWSSAEKGFSGVPPTVMVKCLHRGFNYPEGYDNTCEKIKIGSLQMFVRNNGSCEDIGPHSFPVHEVHKISVLDIRLANADRHAGNILITREGEDGKFVLTPIDHGYCLPENFEDCTFDWIYWPQARHPYSAETINYIRSLDAEEDIQLLKSHGWDLPNECARTLRISTMLLKKGAEKGLTPFTIGSTMCRETLRKESAIELMVQEAQETSPPGADSEASFLESLSLIMDRYLDGLSTTS
ncbi:hypothetical protein SAY86_018772 [Trapa natans]|uniref:1-phosphatidylinositol 4-kinase n=1 Tax=Trapa natans TaxID=22666 RepID=A0AAN7LGV7_TRANT|nr:hypothetical protein SAY86_018772 [Trapa natans]